MDWLLYIVIWRKIVLIFEFIIFVKFWMLMFLLVIKENKLVLKIGNFGLLLSIF